MPYGKTRVGKPLPENNLSDSFCKTHASCRVRFTKRQGIFREVPKLLRLLDEHYPADVKCFLTHETPWQLLVATILSAQCTDARVNMITPGLFERYPSVQSLAEADQAELEQIIRTAGFFRTKAANIIASMRLLHENYDGKMPDALDVLLSFPGVGRKTANLILGHVYDIPGIVVDTHVARVSFRLGLTGQKDPHKIELDLMSALPKEHWIRFNTQIISHGRAVCKARGAGCGECVLSECCLKAGCR